MIISFHLNKRALWPGTHQPTEPGGEELMAWNSPANQAWWRGTHPPVETRGGELTHLSRLVAGNSPACRAWWRGTHQPAEPSGGKPQEILPDDEELLAAHVEADELLAAVHRLLLPLLANKDINIEEILTKRSQLV